MADFTRQREFKTREAVLKVDPGLALGVHTFQLVVEDESGNRSKPAQVRVEIVRILISVTPVVPVTPARPVIPTPPIITRRPTG